MALVVVQVVVVLTVDHPEDWVDLAIHQALHPPKEIAAGMVAVITELQEAVVVVLVRLVQAQRRDWLMMLEREEMERHLALADLL